MSRLLLFRVDASPEIGTGHAMRCLALAQAWIATGGQAKFVSTQMTESVARRLADEGIEVVDAITVDAAAVVVDGYQFDDAFEADLPHPLMAIDDYGHASHVNADFVLNQNLYATKDLYPNTNARLLLGARYALLRREFASLGRGAGVPPASRRASRPVGTEDTRTKDTTSETADTAGQDARPERAGRPPHVLLTLGGAASEEELNIVRALIPADYQVTVARNVTDMPSLMASADLAITAGGSTCWELVFMGVPMVVLVLAENQRPVAESIEAHALGIHLRDLKDLEQALRDAETLKPSTLIDGQGAHRVVMHLRAARLGLRRATLEDARMIWEWANDPLVRAVSFSSEPIPWEGHLNWFSKRINDPGTIFLIGTDRAEPIGQVRFDLEGPEEATISVSLGPSARGKGHGSVLIWRASQELFETSSATMIHAYVKHDNDASSRAFQKAGYRKTGTKQLGNSEAAHFVLTREDLS